MTAGPADCVSAIDSILPGQSKQDPLGCRGSSSWECDTYRACVIDGTQKWPGYRGALTHAAQCVQAVQHLTVSLLGNQSLHRCRDTQLKLIIKSGACLQVAQQLMASFLGCMMGPNVEGPRPGACIPAVVATVHHLSL